MKCKLCNREGVKLWMPKDKSFLICAECAEKMRIPIDYTKYEWQFSWHGLIWEKVGIEQRVLIKDWMVAEDGTVPVWKDSPNNRDGHLRTTELRVDPSNQILGADPVTVLTPAIQVGKVLYGWDDVPNTEREKWTAIPTR